MRTDQLAGGTLADRLRSGPLERREVQQLAQDLLEMLASLHGSGKLHRDLNPTTIQLDHNGRLHSSKVGPQRATGRIPDGPIGSRNYLSPELLSGGPADVAADLFACGVLLSECAGSDASAPVLVVIGMLTASEPDLRPGSATEALALLGVGDAHPVADHVPAPAAAYIPAPAPAPTPAPPAPRAPVAGYRQSFEKPAPPAPAPADVPTEAIEFPPVAHASLSTHAPLDSPAPAFVQDAEPLPAYPSAAVRYRRRPGRRAVLATSAGLIGLAVVTGVLMFGGGSDAPAKQVPAPADGTLSQQLDGLDQAIDGLAK